MAEPRFRSTSLRVTISDTPSTRTRQRKVAGSAAHSEAEAEQLRAIAARAQEDLAAVRRRAAREATTAELTITAKLVMELVPVMDDLERALAASDIQPDERPADDHPFLGVYLIYRQMLRVLAGFGVEDYVADGESFDPHLHDAINAIDAASLHVSPGTVVDTHTRGYRIETRVLRPARVTVAR